MTALEDPNAAANLMSIDYEKAFNRMSHPHCINALKKYGASDLSIDMVSAFLYGRTMRVKVGSALSNPRTVPGGSPQGSILGNFLFCVATRELGELGETESEGNSEQDENSLGDGSTVSFERNGISGSDVSGDGDGVLMSPISRPGGLGLASNDSSNTSNDSFDFRYFCKRPTILEDTVLSARWNQDDIDAYLGTPAGWTERPLAVKVYIDDLNNIEKVKQSTAISIISDHKTTILPHAVKSETNFGLIKSRAEEMGMRVNAGKTQLLCISSNNVCRVQSYIRFDGEEIRSSSELKILGFWFGSKPNVDVHVNKLLSKFRSRLWALRHLKKSGMSPGDLLFVYTTVLRPLLDFAAPTYHSLLNIGQTLSLEALQKKALRIVYNPEISYEEALAVSNITTLEERRRNLTRDFALSTSKNTRYKDGWFPQKPNQNYSIRKPRPYIETQYKTERMRKNPINYMRKLLNDEYEQI